MTTRCKIIDPRQRSERMRNEIKDHYYKNRLRRSMNLQSTSKTSIRLRTKKDCYSETWSFASLIYSTHTWSHKSTVTDIILLTKITIKCILHETSPAKMFPFLRHFPPPSEKKCTDEIWKPALLERRNFFYQSDVIFFLRQNKCSD